MSNDPKIEALILLKKSFETGNIPTPVYKSLIQLLDQLVYLTPFQQELVPTLPEEQKGYTYRVRSQGYWNRADPSDEEEEWICPEIHRKALREWQLGEGFEDELEHYLVTAVTPELVHAVNIHTGKLSKYNRTSHDWVDMVPIPNDELLKIASEATPCE